MVPMRARNGVRAFHEPEGRARHSVRAGWQYTNGARGTDAAYQPNWFMVPMRARKRKGDFHEATGRHEVVGSLTVAITLASLTSSSRI